MCDTNKIFPLKFLLFFKKFIKFSVLNFNFVFPSGYSKLFIEKQSSGGGGGGGGGEGLP